LKNVAVIDIGSNSVRLVLFEITATGFKVIDDMKETVRLGEDLEKDGLIKETAIGRTIKTLKMFNNVCQANNAPILAVATAAARKAKNSQELIRRLQAETGIAVRIISGEEEALLDYQGVVNSIDIQDGLIIDIGGGSSELVGSKIRSRRGVKSSFRFSRFKKP
jgi:exopolyphosphatase/guanosine-5'-triphosphate,3'-diphosphate pyrophosphatase